MAQLGWDETIITAFEDLVRPKLSPPDLYAFARRFGVDVGTAQNYLGKLGYTPDDIAAIEQLTTFSPSPSDLILFGVREAWRDEIAAKWGYDADFPANFGSEMERLGDRENWAKMYWRSHWQLPSVSSGLEMLHRQVITLEEFKELLYLADFPAEWRERITQVAYAPYTRVDVRRMHKMGVLSDEELVKAYMDGGYDREHAENLAQFTILYNLSDDREATKADILGGFRDGMLAEGEAIEWLQGINYSLEVARFLVEREQHKRNRALTNERVKVVKELYTHEEITYSEATARLGEIGLNSNEVASKLELWDIERLTKTKRPSRATLEKFFKEDTIDRAAFVEQMKGLGYIDTYIAWYLKSVTEAKAEERRKSEERMREEQEKIRRRKEKTDYQVDKARLDLNIAELRAAIAETQLVLQELEEQYYRDRTIIERAATPEQIQIELRNARRPVELDIAELQEEIKGFRTTNAELQEEIAKLRLQALPAEIELPEAELKAIIGDKQANISTLRAEIDQIETMRADVKTRIVAKQLQLRPGDEGWSNSVIDTLSTYDIAVLGQIESGMGAALRAAEPAEQTLSPELTEQLVKSFDLAREQAQDAIATIRVEVDELRAKALTDVTLLSDEERNRLVAEREVNTQANNHEIAMREADIQGKRTDLLVLEGEYDYRMELLRRRKSLAEIERQYRAEVMTLETRLANLKTNITQLQQQKARLDVGYREVA